MAGGAGCRLLRGGGEKLGAPAFGNGGLGFRAPSSRGLTGCFDVVAGQIRNAQKAPAAKKSSGQGMPGCALAWASACGVGEAVRCFFRHQIYAIIFPPHDFSRQLFAVGILPRVFRRQIFTAKFPPWDVSLAFVTSWRAGCGDFAPVAPLVGVAAPPRDRAHKIRHAVLQPGARSRGPGRLYRGRCAGGGQRSIYTVSGQTLDLMHNIANGQVDKQRTYFFQKPDFFTSRP